MVLEPTGKDCTWKVWVRVRVRVRGTWWRVSTSKKSTLAGYKGEEDLLCRSSVRVLEAIRLKTSC